MNISAQEQARMVSICQDCQRTLLVCPSNTAVLKRLGYALWVLGKYQEVEEVCTRILSLDPGNADWLYSRAMAHLGLGQAEKAVKDLVEASQATKDHRILAVISEALESIENLRIRQSDQAA